MQSEFEMPPKSHCQDQIEHLVGYLFGRGAQWTTAKEIQASLGYDDRKTRHFAELSGNRIVSGPGCPGYRHAAHTTLEQIGEIVNRLQSQGRKMFQRSISLSKFAHRTIR